MTFEHRTVASGVKVTSLQEAIALLVEYGYSADKLGSFISGKNNHGTFEFKSEVARGVIWVMIEVFANGNIYDHRLKVPAKMRKALEKQST